MTDVPEIHARPKIVGARVKRTEDPRLLTGLGSYTDDRQVARVLYVAFRPWGRSRISQGTAAELTSIYWHFMDVLWIFLFALLTLGR